MGVTSDYALNLHNYYRQFRLTTLDLATEELRIVENPAEFYIYCTDFEDESSYHAHIAACQTMPDSVMGFPVGSYYSIDKVLNMDIDTPSGYCSYCIGKPANMNDFQMIPRGKYMTYRYADDTRMANTKITAHTMSFIKNAGYRLSDVLYVIPFTHSVGENGINNYQIRLFAAVQQYNYHTGGIGHEQG